MSRSWSICNRRRCAYRIFKNKGVAAAAIAVGAREHRHEMA
jgi:hypothetical protein